MNNRNKNNSIIFLTTLSVYLGLVLVGAPTTTLAQNILTREQYEREFARQNKEELDKPLNDANLFVPQIIQFINEINLLSAKQEFNWKLNSHYEIEGLTFCESDNSPAFSGSGNLDNRKFTEIFDDFAVRLGREIAKRRTAKKLGDFYSQNISFDFLTENSSASIKITIEDKSSQDARVFYGEIKNYFEKFASFPAFSEERIVYEDTKVTSENNQVFIVTRLPRGSLDVLLKQDAKAENQ